MSEGEKAARSGSLTTITVIHFGFADRLRVLFGAKVRVAVHTDTEHPPGEALSVSSAVVFSGDWQDPPALVAEAPLA